MFIDENIPLPPNMPKMLQADFKTLQELYDKDDDLTFDLYWEGVEASIKNFCIEGKITKDELKQIFHRYGIMI